MKRNTILTLFAAAVIAAMSITGCDSSSQEAVNEATEAVSEIVSEVAVDAQDASSEAQEALSEAGVEAQEALNEAGEDLQDASDEFKQAIADRETYLATVKDVERSPEEELEVLKEHLVFMGSLAITDPENDLMMSIFKNDGVPVAIFEKLGNIYYGEFTTEDATLDDGREYIKIFIDGKEFGYHFKLNDDDPDSFLVDEDGTVYPAKEGAESAAFDMVLDTLQ